MKITFILLILAAIAALFIFRQTKNTVPVVPTDEITIEEPVVAVSDADVTLDERTFSVFWQEIEGNKISLIPNFDDRDTSAQIVEEYACSYGTNSGFYTEGYKPIGLFIADGNTLSRATLHETFNGFFVRESDGALSLMRTPPTENVSFAIQSGPYMDTQTILRIREDEFDRRIVVVKTVDDQWYFVAITQKENLFSGPQLAQVPQVLSQLPFSIDVALNLDGGSASAFHNTKGVHLGELTPVGSFFCGNE